MTGYCSIVDMAGLKEVPYGWSMVTPPVIKDCTMSLLSYDTVTIIILGLKRITAFLQSNPVILTVEETEAQFDEFSLSRLLSNLTGKEGMEPMHLTSRKRTTAFDCLTAPDDERGIYFNCSTVAIVNSS